MRKILSILLIYIFSVNLNAQESFSTLVSKIEKTVVLIKTYDEKGNILKIGSGFFIDNKGILVSNFHVFDKCKSAKITTSNNIEFVVDRILLSSKNDDIIKFSVSNPENIVFYSVKTVKTKPLKGDDIFVIGNPEGLHNSVSKGIISSIRNVQNYGDIYQITAPISPGSSGSPVFNMNGEVFGIASFQLIEGQNLNFAIDISTLDRIQSNDMILSSLEIKKELPKDKKLALNTIIMIKNDTSISYIQKPKEQLYYYDEFIRNYPNDYEGYFKRAQLLLNEYTSFIDYENFNIENYNKSVYKLFLKIKSDYTKLILLKPEDNKITYYRGVAKMSYVDLNIPFKIPEWTYESALEDFKNCNFAENSIYNFLKTEGLAKCYRNLNQNITALKFNNKAINILLKVSEDEITTLIKETTKFVKPSEFRLVTNSELYYNRGQLKLEVNKDTVGAISDIDTSIKFSIEFGGENIKNFITDRLLKRASLKYNINDLSGALSDYKSVNSNFRLATKYSYLMESVLIKELGGDLNEALVASDNSIKRLIEPYEKYDSYYFYNRADIYFKLGYDNNALIDVNKAIELDNSINTDYLFLKVDISSKINDNIGALADVNKIILLDNKDDYAHYMKGLILWRLNDNVGAEQSFTKAIELKPKSSEYYLKRGSVRYQSNKTGACADWSKAGELGEYKAYDFIKDYCK